MVNLDNAIKTEINDIVEKGIRIVDRAASLHSEMKADELTDVST